MKIIINIFTFLILMTKIILKKRRKKDAHRHVYIFKLIAYGCVCVFTIEIRTRKNNILHFR